VARRLTQGLYEGEKVAVRWAEGPAELPKDQVKLLVNLIVIAAQAIPRGGEVAVEVTQEGPNFRLAAQGLNAKVPAVPSAIFAGNPPEGRIDAHNIQPYYAARLAEAIGLEVAFAASDDVVKITAAPRS
jgi:histidine phosphotransferase ChpT